MPNPPANLPFEPSFAEAPEGRPSAPPPPPPPSVPTPPPASRGENPPTATQSGGSATMPAKRALGGEPEDIFSNIEAARVGEKLEARSSKLGASSGQGPLPSGVGGALKTFLIILVIIVAVVAIGGGLFWFFVLRTPAESGTPNEIPAVKTNGSPIPPAPTPTQPVIPTPVTEPPDGVNIPPPTSVTDTPPVEPEPEVDTDGDGLNDRRETEIGLDPNNPDTDGDGLTDGEEILTYGTNPMLADTDGDGFSDAEEIRNGYNPIGAGQCANPDCRP